MYTVVYVSQVPRKSADHIRFLSGHRRECCFPPCPATEKKCVRTYVSIPGICCFSAAAVKAGQRLQAAYSVVPGLVRHALQRALEV